MVTTVTGQKVLFKCAEGDTIYAWDTEYAKRHLISDKVYTIKECRRFAFGMVMLEEVPGEWFKIAHFEDLKV